MRNHQRTSSGGTAILLLLLGVAIAGCIQRSRSTPKNDTALPLSLTGQSDDHSIANGTASLAVTPTRKETPLVALMAQEATEAQSPHDDRSPNAAGTTKQLGRLLQFVSPAPLSTASPSSGIVLPSVSTRVRANEHVSAPAIYEVQSEQPLPPAPADLPITADAVVATVPGAIEESPPLPLTKRDTLPDTPAIKVAVASVLPVLSEGDTASSLAEVDGVELPPAPAISSPAPTKSEPGAAAPIDLAQADALAAAEPDVDTPPAAETASPSEPFEYTGRKISLDFKSADIHDVLRILADVSGLNIVATDDVKARVTLRLVEVPWDQALDVVLQANGLEKVHYGNVITISTTKRLEAERTGRLAAKTAEQKLAPLETVYVKVNYIKATDLVSLITREAQQRTTGAAGATARAPGQTRTSSARGRTGGTQVALMSPRGTIAADSTTNIVIIHDVQENIDAIRDLIRNIDIQTPQVVIESYIVTANENAVRDLGVQWGYQFLAGPQTGNPTGLNFPGRVGVGGSPTLNTGAGGIPFIADFPASATAGAGSALDLFLGSLSGSDTLTLRLSALERAGKARIISRPRVVTLNNQPAEIRNRREVRVPVISGAIVVGGAGTSGGQGAFEEFDVGITLKITPQISSDGFVLLDVDAESSEIAADASILPSGAGSAFPIIRDVLRRNASSSVLIRAGDTFVLGGILQDNINEQKRGVPYLKEIPGFGWLFRNDVKNTTKEELLVFLTPRLVAGVSTAQLPSAQQLWENRRREAVPPAEIAPLEPIQP